VNLHGMPGGSQTPSWVHLSATARVNATSIQVDADVSSWPVGGRVAIASTDYKMDQAETVVISDVTAGEVVTSVVHLVYLFLLYRLMMIFNPNH
jgi:hypothetical protein